MQKKNSQARPGKRRIDMDRPPSTNAINAVRRHQAKPQAARQLLLGAITLAIFASFYLFMSGSGTNAPSPSVAASQQSEPPATTQPRAAYGQLPLSFEVNRGQADESVNFLARGAGYTIALTPTKAVFALARRSDERSQSNDSSLGHNEKSDAVIRTRRDASSSSAHGSEPTAVLRMNLVGANQGAAVEGLNELEGKVNYLIGSDRSQWRTNISTFARVRYAEVYPGIDVMYYGNQKRLEYDFVVAPGRDSSVISLKFEGADKVEVNAAGDLLLTLGESVVRQPKPVVYQEVDGERLAIAGNYVVTRDGQVGFSVGAYDAQLPLVIDPVLEYSTYLGGSVEDASNDIKVDSAGNAYICGNTASTNFPTSNALQGTFGGANFFGARDGFVTKLNAAGNALVYSTYLGGGGDDRCNKIAVDSSGNAYVAGETTSTNFPTANAFQATYGGGLSDAFVAKLNATGSAFVYSTFLGGSIFDAAHALTIDAAGNAYITGRTTSSNFPTANAIQALYSGGPGADAFVTKLNVAGNALVYSTYLGGNAGIGGGFTAGFSIAVDSAGNAYVTGQTRATNFPTLNPIQAAFGGGDPDGDAFVTKFNAAGTAFIYSTYLGGSDNDIGFEIAVDSSGNAHVVGVANSSNFPTANAFKNALTGTSDGFVTKLNAVGSAFVYSTYLGGSADDSANGITVDNTGNAYVTGGTTSTNFPTVNPTQGANAGGVDGFVTRFNPVGSALLYSTYLGGSGNDAALAIAVDSAASMYLTGRTTSTNFPTLNPVQAANAGAQDAFITKISDAPPKLIGLGNTTYTIREDADITPQHFASLTVNVTRTGDTSTVASVQYQTDQSGGTDCQQVTGKASQRCDYTHTTGILRFAAGETTKTITIPIINDVYDDGNEVFTLQLQNPTGASLGAISQATITIEDDDTAAGVNPIDNNNFFIRQHYLDFLAREPEAAGFAYWTGILNSCGNDQECLNRNRVEISSRFFIEMEFQGTGFYVMRLYKASYGRFPTYLEFMTDRAQVQNSTASQQDFARVWVQRPAFVAEYPAALTPNQFVTKLFDKAGVADPTARAAAEQGLTNGTKTRADVVFELVELASFREKEFNPAFVRMQYFGYLRRDAEADGESYWNNILANVSPNNYRALVCGFVNSREYHLRFGPTRGLFTELDCF
jgi:hypothetical protein